VREPWSRVASSLEAQDTEERPAHPSNRLVVQLNLNWRVIDDPLQWILQRRKGNRRGKNTGWQSRSFCRTLDALLRCIREHCGEIDIEALAKLKSSLPDLHPDWDRRTHRTNLDVRGTDRVQAEQQSEPLPAQGLEVCEADD
jgi:hypothetical protein